MLVQAFAGDTFVAYTDISGFREMMKNESRAVQALDRMYQAGYRILRAPRELSDPRVEAVFVRPEGEGKEAQHHSLLAVIQQLNKDLLQHDIILRTSIAHGQFSYHERLEFTGIEKSPIYGNAYAAAFLDNEAGKLRKEIPTPRIRHR